MEFQTIELNQPINALMAYTSGSSRSYAIEHYFDTSVFEGVDVVHAITFNFYRARIKMKFRVYGEKRGNASLFHVIKNIVDVNTYKYRG